MTDSSLPLRPWFGALALLAVVACLQSLLFPRWPKAAPLNRAALTNALETAGLKPTPLPPLAATRTFERASSPALAWKLAGDQDLLLLRASSRERVHFQLAFLARAVPSLAIKNRRVQTQPVATALGLSQGRKSRLTCLLPSRHGKSRFGVTNLQLATLESKEAVPRMVRLSQILGYPAASGHTCVLISLRAQPGHQLPDAKLWNQVLRAVGPVVLHGASSKPTT